MSTPHVVGGEVDAYCTKCKLELGHTILAMVGTKLQRVRCNTCQGEHAFKAHAPGTPVKRKAKPRSEARSGPRSSGQTLEELLRGRDASQPHRYKLIEVFVKGEVIDHPSFGTGVVVDVRGDRFDAVFQAGLKTLAQRKAITNFAKRQERAPMPDNAADTAAEAAETELGGAA